MSIRNRLVRAATPRLGALAPGPAAALVHRALDRAVQGVGPLAGAAASAESHLGPAGLEALRAGTPLPQAQVDRAVRGLVAAHVRMAATQGFATNLGGLAAMAATVPANLAGLARVQSHMVAGIAHLGGHDLHEPAVRDAVLACLLGERGIDELVVRGTLPGRPRDLLAEPPAPGSSAAVALDRLVAREVARDLLGRISGRRATTAVGRRVPVVGGAVGAASDARSTEALGAYAARELLGGRPTPR